MPADFSRIRRFLPSITNDYWRQNISAVLAIVCAGVFFAVRLNDGGIADGENEGWPGVPDYVIQLVLPGWVAFCAIYCGLTHRVFAKMGPDEFLEIARSKARADKKWWHSWVGSTDPAGWTVLGGVVATALVVILAQNGYSREDPIYIFLGLAVAAGSWVLMAYSYSLTYMRAHGAGEVVDFPFDEQPVFGDFLSHAVFVSTFLGPQARVRSRSVLNAMRTHALLAFMFNAVVVAMTVSLLFGTFSG